ncbi:unnamed protein product [Vitrella brassicaformis CCMP3155]|uniref:U2A'/phosphoprotein 32 family A C-terminal domain-containing protein n=4 Tax=Vitrella brassicaformis TaxID=1169539 RepID=A0A0G4FPI8_VITBC|nr:unnamed protein product [Vitrella brassicaformis CCMP3155]|eukprot:CEM15921.1 unnamed protein product [Vitrella brassicaformis CCMP3155]
MLSAANKPRAINPVRSTEGERRVLKRLSSESLFLPPISPSQKEAAENELSAALVAELSGSDGDDETVLSQVDTLIVRGAGIARLDGLHSVDFRWLRSLEVLSLSHNALTDICPLQHLVRLRSLNLNFNQLRDLSPAFECPQLESLYASHNQVMSIKGIEACQELQALCLFRNSLADLGKVIESLSTLPLLEQLDLNGNPCMGTTQSSEDHTSTQSTSPSTRPSAAVPGRVTPACFALPAAAVSAPSSTCQYRVIAAVPSLIKLDEMEVDESTRRVAERFVQCGKKEAKDQGDGDNDCGSWLRDLPRPSTAPAKEPVITSEGRHVSIGSESAEEDIQDMNAEESVETGGLEALRQQIRVLEAKVTSLEVENRNVYSLMGENRRLKQQIDEGQTDECDDLPAASSEDTDDVSSLRLENRMLRKRLGRTVEHVGQLRNDLYEARLGRKLRPRADTGDESSSIPRPFTANAESSNCMGSRTQPSLDCSPGARRSRRASSLVTIQEDQPVSIDDAAPASPNGSGGGSDDDIEAMLKRNAANLELLQRSLHETEALFSRPQTAQPDGRIQPPQMPMLPPNANPSPRRRPSSPQHKTPTAAPPRCRTAPEKGKRPRVSAHDEGAYCGVSALEMDVPDVELTGSDGAALFVGDTGEVLQLNGGVGGVDGVEGIRAMIEGYKRLTGAPI